MPSGETLHIAPGGTPPRSPIRPRPIVTAVIQSGASTITSWIAASEPSSVTTSLQRFCDKTGFSEGGR
jgi:hypothetical protein